LTAAGEAGRAVVAAPRAAAGLLVRGAGALVEGLAGKVMADEAREVLLGVSS
jgi:hypothetical protein